MATIETVRKNHSKFKKMHSILNLKQILDELFAECEHGDAEHRQWLKDKFEDFRKRKEDEDIVRTSNTSQE
jgi:hypothetical protein